MKSSKTKNGQPVFENLVVNGLVGRCMFVPSSGSSAKQDILFVYGVHSSLERMAAIAQTLSKYGNVMMPDLPGFGGMDSLYKIGSKPTLDNLADYLATFIKLRYKNNKFTLGGMSFGFVVVTRMLQRHPELCSQVDLLVSMVGFTHKDDFKFSRVLYRTIKYSTFVFSTRIPAWFLKYFIFRSIFIKTAYLLMSGWHVKMKGANKRELTKRINFEVLLWQCNDIRTYMSSIYQLMTLDITNEKVSLPVMHMSVAKDQYFHAKHVKAGLKKVFTGVKIFEADMPNHAPTIISDADEAEQYISEDMRQALAGARPS